MKNPNEPCNVQISFGDGRVVVIEKLSERQQRQLSEALQASGVHYQWQAWLVRRPTIGGRLSALWRRLNAWMMGGAFLLLIAFAQSAFAQKPLKPRPLEPIKISVETDGEKPHDQTFDARVRAELRKPEYRDVVISSSPEVDFNVIITVSPISEDIHCAGYVVTLLTINKEKRGHRFRQSNHTGDDLMKLAAVVVARLDRDFFQPKRR